MIYVLLVALIAIGVATVYIYRVSPGHIRRINEIEKRLADVEWSMGHTIAKRDDIAVKVGFYNTKVCVADIVEAMIEEMGYAIDVEPAHLESLKITFKKKETA